MLVPSGSVDEARVAIDKAGLAVNGEHEGYQLLDSLGMSSTDFQQNVAMKRALEGELANQIQNISGVSDATVNLAMPQQTLFLADQKSPTASVLLTLSGAGFDDAAVRGVQRLVANAVSGLTPANVVIADQAGDLLSSSDGGIGDAAASKLATESRYSRQLEAGAQQIVDQMLGPGQGLVSINARLNLDTQTEKQITYGKTGTPLQQSTEKENLKGNGSGATGPAGTASNIPGYAAGTLGRLGNRLHAHEGRPDERRRPDRDGHDEGGRDAHQPVRRDRVHGAALDPEDRVGHDAGARRAHEGPDRGCEGGRGLPRHHPEGHQRGHRHVPDLGLDARVSDQLERLERRWLRPVVRGREELGRRPA